MIRHVISRPAWGGTVLLTLALFAMVPRQTDAGSITLTATSDAYAQSTTGNGVYNYLFSHVDLPILNIPGTVQDVALMTFDFSQLPRNMTITSISFAFTEAVVTTNPGTIVNIDAYTTPNYVALGDANGPTTQVGSYDSVALGLGHHSVAVSAATLLGLVSSNGGLGILLQGVVDTTTAILSVEGAPIFQMPPPQLIINFASVPEPSTAVLLATASFVGLIAHGRRRRLASADVALERN